MMENLFLASVICSAWANCSPDSNERTIEKSQSSSPLPVICRNVVLNEGSQLLLPKPRNDLPTSVLAWCTAPLDHELSPLTVLVLVSWRHDDVLTCICVRGLILVTSNFISLFDLSMYFLG